MNLRHWQQTILATLSETGSEVDTVRLVSVADGQVWHVWLAPFGDDWADAAELQLRELSREWPSRPHAVRFVAESDGSVMSVAPMTIQGQSREALSAVASEQQALADAAQAQSRTTQAILEASNVQIHMLLSTLESMGKRQDQLLAAVAAREEQSLGSGLSDETQQRAIALLERIAPVVLHRLTTKGKET